MHSVLQAALPPDTPQIGAHELLVAIYVWGAIALVMVALVVDFLWDGPARDEAEPRGPVDDLMSLAPRINSDSNELDAAYAEVQARCVAAGVEPPL